MNETKNSNRTLVQRMVLSSVLIALAAVLSLIKVYKLPLGGSITLLSMLPIAMISVMYGTKWGLWSAFVYSVIQLIFGITMDGLLGWGLTWYALIGTIVLDYLAAFTVLGLSGMLRKKGIVGVVIGTAIALALRFVSHFVSGVIIFGTITSGDSWIYSLTYNGSYMLPELIITCIGAAVLFNLPQVKRLIGIKD